MSVRWFAALCVLVLSPAFVGAEEPTSFAEFRPLTADELYAKRLRFQKREPIVSVGVVEGQNSIALRADEPVRLIFDEVGMPKTVYAPSGETFTFKPIKATRARLRYWTIVETHPYSASAAAKKTARAFEKRGLKTKLFVTGTIMALKGNVLDTRERRVGVGGFDTEAQAKALMSSLSLESGTRSFVHTELLERAKGTIAVFDQRGRLMHKATGGVVYFGAAAGGKVELLQAEHETVTGKKRKESRKYWGHIYVVIDRVGALAAVNSIGTERLLAGVVPAEIFASAPLEALKAQAVTARGAIFAKLGHTNFPDPFHICATQQCQVYGGASYEQPNTNRAVAETRGLLAVRPRATKDKPLELVDSVYSSSSGGFSEANEVVWDNKASQSLRPKLDGFPGDPALKKFAKGLTESNIREWVESYPPTFGARSSFSRKNKYRWKKTLRVVELGRKTASQGVGKLKDIEILGRGRGGRITGLRLIGTLGKKDVLRELPVRRLFGLNSGMFVIDKEIDPSTKLMVSVTFTGGGWGHGVGMCQMGAIGRAEHNQDFRQILAHYYNGARVERIY